MSLTEAPAKSLADQILGASDIESATLDVPEWGVTLELRSPSAEERAAFITRFMPDDWSEADENYRPDLTVMYCAAIITMSHDPLTGERVFEMNDSTMAALAQKNGAVVERVALEAMKLAGIEKDAVEEGKSDS